MELQSQEEEKKKREEAHRSEGSELYAKFTNTMHTLQTLEAQVKNFEV